MQSVHKKLLIAMIGMTLRSNIKYICKHDGKKIKAYIHTYVGINPIRGFALLLRWKLAIIKVDMAHIV